jgi:hypothetical protein
MTTNNIKARKVMASLAQQDMCDDVDDSYARTNDAEDTIRRWYDSAAQAGDTDLCEAVDEVGLDVAAALYAEERARIEAARAPRT